MKTDTEDTVRVTITFNRASNPEWYNVISSITNGRARSEVVKTHLAVPSEERFTATRKVLVQPLNTLPTTKIASEPNLNSAFSAGEETQLSTGTAGNIPEIQETRKLTVAVIQKKSEPPASATLGGLASHLVSVGFKNLRES